MATETMNISLPDTLRRFVEEQVSEGGYGNTSEYIRDLIRRDREARRREAERRLEVLLLQGVNSAERGDVVEATPEYWRERRARLTAQATGETSESAEPEA